MTVPAVAVDIESVGLVFGAQTDAPTVALQDVSCRFEPGKVTALIGPSGCGKSTLLQIARGFLEPSQGRLRFVEISTSQEAQASGDGDGVAGVQPVSWLTVMENVAFGLDLAGVPRAERDARAARPLPPSISTASRTVFRANCPAACASVSALPAPW